MNTSSTGAAIITWCVRSAESRLSSSRRKRANGRRRSDASITLPQPVTLSRFTVSAATAAASFLRSQSSFNSAFLATAVFCVASHLLKSQIQEQTMRAVVYHGVGDIRLENVPEPRILKPNDAIVRLTASAICGTDLHLVRGTVPGMFPGTVLGHEGGPVV